MERLSLLDAEFLHLEDGIAHMHIAGISTFEGPPPPIEDLLDLLRRKLHLIPRYRQRIRTVPLELGRPVWVDDPFFNLEYHVRHTALPPPGDDADLCRLMARLMSQPLDRNRPLWECWLVEGLPDDRWALISKVHHCMVDGISGVDLLTVLLDLEREPTLPDAGPWEPEAEPTTPELVLDAWSGFVQDAGGFLRGIPDSLRDPAGAFRGLVETGQGLARFGQRLRANEPLSIEGKIGPHRVWAHSSIRIEDIKTIRKAFGGTLNDVVLAAVTGGYRAVLLERGDDVERAALRSLVPVSVRAEDARGVLDNRVSAVLFDLPVAVEDPVERLERVHDEMAALKTSHMAEAGELVTSLGNLAPPMLVGTVSRLAIRVMHELPQHTINTVTTNVPGPQFPLYCLGREMLSYLPYVPISHGLRIGTAILSYNGAIAFGITGDFSAAPEVQLLADTIVAEIDTMRERAEEALAATETTTMA